MSIELLEEAAAALGDLTDEVVFLGAATLPLWITDPAAPPVRPTVDVDVVVEVTTLIAYNDFEQRLRRSGFRDDGTMIGRFLFGEAERQLDVIPADASIIGFENRWQRASLPATLHKALPSGMEIKVLPPANLLATKLEAFAGRGKGDFLASADFEDIVVLIDGRDEIVGETLAAEPDLRTYIAAELSKHLHEPRAREAIVAHLEVGRDGRQRADSVVFPRLDQMTAQ
jgi:predicted nucleotidyltransferase